MAIYYSRVSVIGRSAGRSATAAAAYRSGEQIVDRRTGEEHDYERRLGVERTEIIAPEHAPEWVFDREELWNRVEEAEARRDAQLCREVVVALPEELNADQRAELVREYAREEFAERGMVADCSIHEPGREGDERNYHAHILVTMRTLDEDGFGAKNREWNSREQLEEWRSSWADHANQALERADCPERIDHRRLEVQRFEAAERGQWERAVELDREPQVHKGPAVVAFEREIGHERDRERERDRDRERAPEPERGDGRESRRPTEPGPARDGGDVGEGRRDREAPSQDRGAGGAAGAADRLADAVDRALDAARGAIERTVDRVVDRGRELAREFVDDVRAGREAARAMVDRAREALRSPTSPTQGPGREPEREPTREREAPDREPDRSPDMPDWGPER